MLHNESHKDPKTIAIAPAIFAHFLCIMPDILRINDFNRSLISQRQGKYHHNEQLYI